MSVKTVEIVSPNGQQRATIVASSQALWLRKGWTPAAQVDDGAADPASGARDDSAETLGADGRTAENEE